MSTQDVSVARYFAGRPDPRVDRAKTPLPGDLLATARRAVGGGADGWAPVETFGGATESRVKRFRTRPHGLPGHDTVARVFARVDPAAFGACGAAWRRAVCAATGVRPLAIAGPAVRAAPRGPCRGCRHRVRAWAVERRLILGPQAVADGSQAIAALPGWRRVRELTGAVVTLDAAGWRTAVARPVRDRGGDALPAVKGNPPAPRAAVRAVFARACGAAVAGVDHDAQAAIADGHGRHEERSVTVVRGPPGRPPGWPAVAAVAFVGREREGTGKRADTARDDVTGLRGPAARPGGLVRRHWAVEDELDGRLDGAFRADAHETAAGHAGANRG